MALTISGLIFIVLMLLTPFMVLILSISANLGVREAIADFLALCAGLFGYTVNDPFIRSVFVDVFLTLYIIGSVGVILLYVYKSIFQE